MYILSAWTGYRKGEIGSLTTQAFDLESDPPTVTVQAAFTKRKRTDTQVLHPDVVQRFQEWLQTKPDLPRNALLFPVSGTGNRRLPRPMVLPVQDSPSGRLRLAGPDYATRCEMFDFLVAELCSREPLCSHRIGPAVRALSNQRNVLLPFAAELDNDLAALMSRIDEFCNQKKSYSEIAEHLNQEGFQTVKHAKASDKTIVGRLVKKLCRDRPAARNVDRNQKRRQLSRY